MPAAVSWYQENLVVLIQVQGELTLEEMAQVDKETVQHIRQGKQTNPLVHLIVDMRAMSTMPINLSQVNRALTHLKEPGLGWSVMIGMSPVMRFVASTVIQMARGRFRIFEKAEDGIGFLMSQDEHVLDMEIEPEA
jgi:hypothetical protein